MRISYLEDKNGNIVEYPAYTVDELNSIEFKYELDSARKNGKKYLYLNKPFTFDIETTTIDGTRDDKGNYITAPQGFMYHWQLCIMGTVFYGRYWEEWERLLNELKELFGLNEHTILIGYVHNLGFEFQFIQNFLKKLGKMEVFAVSKRKPLVIRCAGFEFRCSWKLSNMSLEKACENEKGMRFKKMAGDLDYTVLRTPLTPLTDKEFSYCIADVVCLYNYIERKLINEGDDLSTIPLTSTGYIRRRCRQKYRSDDKYRKEYLNELMSEEVYTLLLEEARGGDTHANRFMSGRIIHDCDSYDFVSSYIYCLMCEPYPRTKFAYYGNVDSWKELNELLDKYACLFRVKLHNVEINEHIASPYLPFSKCRNLKNYSLDNGRVLTAEELEITVNDIDWKIIIEQYNYDKDNVYITDMHISKYGKSPQFIRDVLMELFGLKCEIKEDIKEYEEIIDMYNVLLNDDFMNEYENLLYMYAKTKNF